MRTTYSYRAYLEQLILSACLQEDGYPQIAGLLTSKNFSSANIEKDVNLSHQKIFEACEKLYPVESINRATLWNKLGRTKEIGIILCEYQTYVCRTVNIREHAMMLNDMCITESFEQFLYSLAAKESCSATLRVAISDFIKQELGHGDALHAIAKAIEIIGQIDAEALSSIQLFKALIDQRAIKMREQIQVDRLFWYLSKLAVDADLNGEIGMAQVCKITKSITIHGTINLSELTKLLNITV